MFFGAEQPSWGAPPSAWGTSTSWGTPAFGSASTPTNTYSNGDTYSSRPPTSSESQRHRNHGWGFDESPGNTNGWSGPSNRSRPSPGYKSPNDHLNFSTGPEMLVNADGNPLHFFSGAPVDVTYAYVMKATYPDRSWAEICAVGELPAPGFYQRRPPQPQQEYAQTPPQRPAAPPPQPAAPPPTSGPKPWPKPAAEMPNFEDPQPEWLRPTPERTNTVRQKMARAEQQGLAGDPASLAERFRSFAQPAFDRAKAATAKVKAAVDAATTAAGTTAHNLGETGRDVAHSIRMDIDDVAFSFEQSQKLRRSCVDQAYAAAGRCGVNLYDALRHPTRTRIVGLAADIGVAYATKSVANFGKGQAIRAGLSPLDDDDCVEFIVRSVTNDCVNDHLPLGYANISTNLPRTTAQRN